MGKTALVTFKLLKPIAAGALTGLQLRQFHANVREGIARWQAGDTAGAVGAFGSAGVDAVGLLATLQELRKTGEKPSAAQPEAPDDALPRIRLTEDVNVTPRPPRASLSGSIGESPAQSKALRADIAAAKAAGATDIRVNQQQVNASRQRVGINRPDLQYTLNGKRYYIEYDTSTSPRGPGHEYRILANDPNGKVILKTVD